MADVVIGGCQVGDGAPCLVIAEIGINHNGDVDLARQLIAEAAAAGADAVKFQNYRTSDFVSDHSLLYEYRSRGELVVESQYEMFARCELRPDDLAVLRRTATDAGVAFLSTPTSSEGVDDLVAVAADGLKNGSDYLTHLPLVIAMARSGLPTVLSTGMATLAEVDDAVRAHRDAGGTDLVLLHCTSSYPTPADEVNLRRIPVLHRAFGCPVGFSDHTAGVTAAVGAVTLGAAVVEKHFTLDRDLPGPDHSFSSDPGELAALVDAIRTAEAALGDEAIGPTASEAQGRRSFRLSCVAAHDLPAGCRLRPDDIAFRRPGTGLPPKDVHLLIDRVLVAPAHRGDVLGPDLLA